MKLDVCQAVFPFAVALPLYLPPYPSPSLSLGTFRLPPLAVATSARCSVAIVGAVAVAALCAPVARFEFGALIYVNAPCSFVTPPSSQLPSLASAGTPCPRSQSEAAQIVCICIEQRIMLH